MLNAFYHLTLSDKIFYSVTFFYTHIYLFVEKMSVYRYLEFSF
jgi:hypothetical protein